MSNAFIHYTEQITAILERMVTIMTTGNPDKIAGGNQDGIIWMHLPSFLLDTLPHL